MCFGNLLQNCSDYQYRKLVNNDIVEKLLNFFDENLEVEPIYYFLICFEYLLEFGNSNKNDPNEVNFIVSQIEINKGFAIFENLQKHPNKQINKLLNEILDKYFLLE